MFFRRNHVKKEESPSEHNRETDRYYLETLDKDDFLNVICVFDLQHLFGHTSLRRVEAT